MATLQLPDMSLVIRLTVAAIFLGCVGTKASTSIQELCPWEDFTAKCGPNEVVVMDTARYGRMKLGRCVKNDLGFVGCFSDVIDVADSMCSGRQECTIKTPNPTFDQLKPCLEDLKSYFEASYRCQPVIAASADMCRSAANFVKVKATEGYLSNAVTMASGCGDNAPWVLEAKPGQRINITLLDFAVMSSHTRSYLGETGCLRYATIKEEDPQRNKLVCGGERRKKFIYTSMGSRLEVRIHSSMSLAEKSQPYFLLKFEVFGCADPPLPDFATYKRSADVATIGCTGKGGATWQLKCRGAEWIGSMGTCADGRSQHSPDYDFVLGNYKISSSLTIAVIIAISIAIGIIILLTGLYCMRRQKQANERKRLARETELYRELAYSDYNKQMMDHNVHERQGGRFHQREPSGRLPTNNEYASIRDWPLPPTPHEVGGYEKNQNGGGGGGGGGSYFRSGQGAYPESIGSGNGSENIYQLPEVSDGSGEELPRYFELDPNNPKGAKSVVAGYPNTGPGVVMPSKEAHYSN